MSKNLDFVPQSHKDWNHISGQIWQNTMVVLIFFIWDVFNSMQNNFLGYFLDIYEK